MKNKANEPCAIVSYFDNARPIKDICGSIYQLSTAKDFSDANLIFVAMNAPSIPHYHCVATEFYYFLIGSGFLIVRNQESHAIGSHMLAIIPPNNAHFIIPASVTEVLVFSTPAWSKKDQIVCDEKDPNNAEVGYSFFSEKSLLIDAILDNADLAFTKGMRRMDKEDLDRKRQVFVLQSKLNNRTIPELREILRIKRR
ncbi:MAG: hypothetical protein V1928_03295 [Parcubacteria group bacterium]